MRVLRQFRWLVLLPLLLMVTTLILAGVADSVQHPTLMRILVALLLAIALSQLALWHYFKQRLLKPLASLERGGEIILETHAAHQLELPANHLLGALPDQLHALGDELLRARAEVGSALKSGAERVQLQKSHLERVIQGLEEGVMVCDAAARILLYNPAAHRLLHQHPALGLGRSLFDLLPRTPLEHTLARLRHNPEASRSMICALNDSERLLSCRIGLLRDEAANQSAGSNERGFVVAFDDVTARQHALHQRDRLFTSTLQGLRNPLANLRAAAETLSSFEDMTADERHAFIAVINSESLRLSEQLSTLAANETALVGQEWQQAHIYSADLIHLLHRQLQGAQLQLTMTGVPQWLHTDSHAVVALFEQLAHTIAARRQLQQFDMEALPGSRGVYLDLAWKGAPLTQTELEDCQNQALPELVGHPQVGELARQLGGELWSQPHPRIDGLAVLRLPLPASPEREQPPALQLPTRPMIYDFDLFEPRPQHESLLDTPLRKLDYVVFDTETTGLEPGMGDEVVSIAAVRIVNQRILPDEQFDQLINPGRAIPRESIQYHGITDEQVRDAPSIVEVLPRFKTFAKDAVLVAHNAWFDMAFIRRREAQSGAYFTNPILDTLMLSVCLHGRDVDQSLDAITQRLGIEILGRHSALGDSLATARLLLAQIDLLEARGIITLRDALNAYR